MSITPEVRYRTAELSDAACLALLATQVFLDTYATDGIDLRLAREVQEHLSLEAISVQLANAETTFLIAERASRLVGFVQITRRARHPLVRSSRPVGLDRLFVQRPFLGQGIGKSLLKKAEALACGEGSETLWMTAWSGNARARAFYRCQGYTDLGMTTYVFEDVTYEDRVLAKSWTRDRVSG